MRIFSLKAASRKPRINYESLNRDGGFLGGEFVVDPQVVVAAPFQPPLTFVDMSNAWPEIASSNEEVRACRPLRFYYPLDDDISGEIYWLFIKVI